jgi:hypothetical protein
MPVFSVPELLGHTVLIDWKSARPNSNKGEIIDFVLTEMRIPVERILSITLETVSSLVMLQLADQETYETALEKLKNGIPWPLAQGATVYGWPASEPVDHVRVTVFPLNLSLEALKDHMAQFGRVLRVSRGTDRKAKLVADGVVHLTMRLEEGTRLPAFIRLVDSQGRLVYPLMPVFTDSSPRVCFKCGKDGHAGYQCRVAGKPADAPPTAWSDWVYSEELLAPEAREAAMERRRQEEAAPTPPVARVQISQAGEIMDNMEETPPAGADMGEEEGDPFATPADLPDPYGTPVVLEDPYATPASPRGQGVARSLDKAFEESMDLEWNYETPVLNSTQGGNALEEPVIQTPSKQFIAVSPGKELRKAAKKARKLARRLERAKRAEEAEEEEDSLPLAQRQPSRTRSMERAGSDTEQETSSQADSEPTIRRNSLQEGRKDPEARANDSGKAKGRQGRGGGKEASPEPGTSRGKPPTLSDFLKIAFEPGVKASKGKKNKRRLSSEENKAAKRAQQGNAASSAGSEEDGGRRRDTISSDDE